MIIRKNDLSLCQRIREPRIILQEGLVDVMRDFYEEQLNELHTQMIAMGGLCEKAISNATKALTDGDLQLAEEIMKMTPSSTARSGTSRVSA